MHHLLKMLRQCTRKCIPEVDRPHASLSLWWNQLPAPETLLNSQFSAGVARYVRRPPIAEHRFTKITDRKGDFLTKDLKEKRVMTTHYLIEEFVDALAAHVPARYRHAMRRFGLLAPRSHSLTSATLFALLGQTKRPRPQRLNWRSSLHKYFGLDPLVDNRGQPVHWTHRLMPVARQAFARGFSPYKLRSHSSEHFCPSSDRTEVLFPLSHRNKPRPTVPSEINFCFSHRSRRVSGREAQPQNRTRCRDRRNQKAWISYRAVWLGRVDLNHRLLGPEPETA